MTKRRMEPIGAGGSRTQPHMVAEPLVPDGIVCVIGAGAVGLVTAVGLADRGRTVHIVESDTTRLETVRLGRAPVFEPGLDDMVQRLTASGRLRVTDDIAEGMTGAGIAIVTVGTPPASDGEADLRQVRDAVSAAAAHAQRGSVIVVKSTVPPGMTRRLADSLRSAGIAVVACPEFLREGEAIHDLRHPSRLVVGGEDRAACERVAALFADGTAPTIITDAASAELIKYGSNAFLALKISFINEIATLCEFTGAEIETVAHGMGLDHRVGREFLHAGLGFGGSCFPKDVRALDAAAGYYGHSFWMLKAAIEVNVQQRRRFVARVRNVLGGSVQGTRIAVLGLAFKPGTDDMRQAPSLDVIRHLEDLGARVTATDPVAIQRAAHLLPATALIEDPYECLRDAEAVLVVTDWPEFRNLDWGRVAGLVARRVVVDGRNCIDRSTMAALGFTYHGVGRQPVLPSEAGAVLVA